MQAVLLRQRLDRQLERHDVVRGRQRVRILKVDLVLALRHFVVRRLDLKAHLLQRKADLAPRSLAVIQRPQIEIARLVARLRRRLALLVRLEQEKLALRAHVEAVAHVRRLLQHALEHPARIAHERRSVRIVHVADQPRHLPLLRTPRQHHERIQIRIQVLVRLVDAHKSFDRASVNHDLVVHRLLDLRCRDRHILQLAEDVRKLHPDKFHVPFLHQPDDVFLAVLAHDCVLPFPKFLLPKNDKQSARVPRTSHPRSVCSEY